jgi:predicted  nucleic acid-binding Zn-ribbon protein
MSIKQIDDALAAWRLRLGAAAQNLLDVQSHPVFRRISAPDAKLSGDTAQKSAVAVRTLSYLMQCFDLLQAAIQGAEELRQDMPSLFGAEEREREISSVLQGKSIHLPAVQVPLQHRTLLTTIENVDTISPPELLKFMESAFENVKQIVLSLDSAWESLGRTIQQASERLSALREKAGDLSVTDCQDLDEAELELKRLEESATHDPLGPASTLAQNVNDSLGRISARLDQLEGERRQAAEGLTAARNLLSVLKSEQESARRVYTEAREKTASALDFDSSELRFQAIAAWFERLNAAAAETSPGSMLVGLKNWINAAQQAQAANRALMSQAQQALETRSELRGRLDALKAKARAYSLAEDDELMALGNQAAALLYKRPTPLDEASALVSAYEAKLNSQAGKLV